MALCKKGKNMTKRKGKADRRSTPLLKVRHLAGIIAIIALFIAGPLGVVWKQVYITQSSVRQEHLSDSLAVLKKQATQLRLSIEKLSSSTRIESIARKSLGLEYPGANRIVIVKSRAIQAPLVAADTNNYMAILKRSIVRGKG
jgi:cell division protein FtsL